MKDYVDLDEVVSCREWHGDTIIIRRRTIADILEEHEADYTPIEAWEIKEEEE